LMDAVTKNSNLRLLVVTGNPFAVNLQSSLLDILLSNKGG